MNWFNLKEISNTITEKPSYNSLHNKKFQLCVSGEGINIYYFPVLLIVGIIGNILSFLVSI